MRRAFILKSTIHICIIRCVYVIMLLSSTGAQAQQLLEKPFSALIKVDYEDEGIANCHLFERSYRYHNQPFAWIEE